MKLLCKFPAYNDRLRSWFKLKELSARDWKVSSTKVDAGDFKYELLNRLRSTMAVKVLKWVKNFRYILPFPPFILLSHLFSVFSSLFIIHSFLYCVFVIPYSGRAAGNLRSRRRQLGVRFQRKSRDFCLLLNLHTVGIRGCFKRARVFELVADHSAPYIATTKTAWCCICISSPPYVSVRWALGLIRHRAKFSFSFLLLI